VTPQTAVTSINGTPVSTVQTVGATTGDWFTDPTQEVISGLPNWGLVAGGVGVLMVMMTMMGGRR
jgi:hypothetical protein